MIAAVASTLMAGLGLLLVLTAQPLGRPRPSLAERLDRLRPTSDIPAESPRVFALSGLDRVLLPTLHAVGGRVLWLVARAGVDLARLDRQLAIVGDRGGPAVHYAQAVLLGLLGLLTLPLLGALGFGPVDAWPPWTWLALSIAGLATPELALRARYRRRMRTLAGDVSAAAEYLYLAVSAGLGLEQALVETANASNGPFFEQLRVQLAHARLRHGRSVDAVRALADQLDLGELSALAGTLESSSHYGTALTDTLRAQTDAARERRRLELLAAGQQAQVTMLLPIAGLILPALFLVLLFPVAANVLQLVSP